MVVNERTRHELYESARAAIGDDAAETLMELLPPVGWGDVATKQDLAVLKEDIVLLKEHIQQGFTLQDERFERRIHEEFRKHLIHMYTAMFLVGGFFLTFAEVMGRTG